MVYHEPKSRSEAQQEVGTPDWELLLTDAFRAREEGGDEGLAAFLGAHAEEAPRLRELIARFDRAVDREVESHAAARPVAAERPKSPEGYTLGALLGAGAVGEVFAATDGAGRPCAIKFLRPGLVGAAAEARFLVEVEALRRLDHQHALRFTEAGEWGGRPYLVCERLHGGTLAEAMERLAEPPVDAAALRKVVGDTTETATEAADSEKPRAVASPRRTTWPYVAADLVRAAAEGVAHAHERGVLHRDLKPSNLFLERSGRVVVIDFGLAFTAGGERLTTTNVPVGTPAYAPPETLRNSQRPPDVRGDVWSLGVCLYELVTFRHPFAAQNVVGTLQLLVDADPPPLPAEVPRDLRAILATALRADPARRYPTMQAFAADLAAFVEGRPVAARPPRFWETCGRAVRRRPGRFATALTALVAALALATSEWRSLRELRRERASTSREQRRNEALLGAAEAQQLAARVEDLWPVRLELGRGERGCERWLADAARVLAGRAAAEARLARLESELPQGEDLAGDDAQDRRRRELEREAAALLASAEGVERNMVYGRSLQREIVARERRRVARELRLIRFGHGPTAVEAEAVVATLAALDDVAAAVPEIEARRDMAVALGERAATSETAAAWRLAADAVGRDPLYTPCAGRPLRPSEDLLPLGPDQRTGLQEFAHLPSGPPATRDATTGELRYADDAGIVLVLLPGGNSVAGSRRPEPGDPPGAPFTDPDAAPTDGPPTGHTLAPFFVAKHETTVAQWNRAVRIDPTSQVVSCPLRPFDHDEAAREPAAARRWTDWSMAARRLGLELPTTVQWEHAARAGATARWCTGDDPAGLRGAANGCDRAYLSIYPLSAYAARAFDFDDGFGLAAPVGSFRPNAFGLYDVHGNVSEFCDDGQELLTEPPVEASTGRRWVRPDGARAARGGGFGDPADRMRFAPRGSVSIDIRDDQTGARFVRSLD